MLPTGTDSAAGKVRNASGPGSHVMVVLPLVEVPPPEAVAVIVEVPASAQVTAPLLLIAICELLDDHATEYSGV